MERGSELYRYYTDILKEELIPAMGCTEPIAIAYAAAKCRDLLGERPDHCQLVVSGSIIKNVKSVIVPNTNGMKGLECALAAGVVGGRAEDKLQVIAGILPCQLPEIQAFLRDVPIDVEASENDVSFYIDVTEYKGDRSARAVIVNYHTNFVRLEQNGTVLLDKTAGEDAELQGTDRSKMIVSDIWDYVNALAIEDVDEMISRQIKYNCALSREGFEHEWGAQIGQVILRESNGDFRMRARAAAAAASDARMNGCELPAVILSGSGNQGITATMPVAVFADMFGRSHAETVRALVLADLVTIHQKTGIGSVSAFCGAVCAGVGAGCGVAYLQGADLDAINHTIVNAIAILSGMICDGAKPSCAAKISAAVDAGLLGYEMYRHGQQFRSGDGIVKKGVEKTIDSVCEIAREGMRKTNDCILQVMLQK